MRETRHAIVECSDQRKVVQIILSVSLVVQKTARWRVRSNRVGSLAIGDRMQPSRRLSTQSV